MFLAEAVLEDGAVQGPEEAEAPALSEGVGGVFS